MLLPHRAWESEIQMSNHMYLKTLPGRLPSSESAKLETMKMESDRNIVLQSL